MNARVTALLLALAIGSAGCPKPVEPAVVPPVRGRVSQDSEVTPEDLARDLESTLLENYLQLSLGNMEAYADSIARDRDVVLIGVRSEDLVVGVNPSGRTRDRRLYSDRRHCGASTSGDMPCIQVLPKTLDLHLYEDESVGWVVDEISYRVPHDDREAAIPLRMTVVTVRDIDRWVLVMEHVSYGLPVAEIIALARRGKLASPELIEKRHDDRGRARLLSRLVLSYLNADEQAIQRRVQAMERKRQSATERGAYVVDESTLFTLYPGPRQEYRGPDVHSAPSLAQLFGPSARVTMDSYRLSVAINKRVAWMAARLTVTMPDPGTGRDLVIGLRGTFLFAFDSHGWNLTQTHISVPVTDALLDERFFGKPPRLSADPNELASERAP